MVDFLTSTDSLLTLTRAKVIWQKATSLVCERNLVDIFYHIRQMAARVAKLVLRGAFRTPVSEKEGRMSSAMVPFKRLSIVTIGLALTIRPQFAIECLRCSNQQGMGQLRQNLGRNRLTDVSQILKRCACERHGAIVCKRNHVDIFCRLNTMHERDRQTDITQINKQTNKQTNRQTIGNRRNHLSAMSPKKSKTFPYYA